MEGGEACYTVVVRHGLAGVWDVAMGLVWGPGVGNRRTMHVPAPNAKPAIGINSVGMPLSTCAFK